MSLAFLLLALMSLTTLPSSSSDNGCNKDRSFFVPTTSCRSTDAGTPCQSDCDARNPVANAGCHVTRSSQILNQILIPWSSTTFDLLVTGTPRGPRDNTTDRNVTAYWYHDEEEDSNTTTIRLRKKVDVDQTYAKLEIGDFCVTLFIFGVRLPVSGDDDRLEILCRRDARGKVVHRLQYDLGSSTPDFRRRTEADKDGNQDGNEDFWFVEWRKTSGETSLFKMETKGKGVNWDQIKINNRLSYDSCDLMYGIA